MDFHSEPVGSKPSIYSLSLYLAMFVVVTTLVAWVFIVPDALAQDTTSPDAQENVDTFTITINGTQLTGPDVTGGLFLVLQNGKNVARVTFSPTGNNDGTFNSGTKISGAITREVAEKKDYKTNIDGLDVKSSTLPEAESRLFEVVMDKDIVFTVEIESLQGSQQQDKPTETPNMPLTPEPTTPSSPRFVLKVNGLQITKEKLKSSENGTRSSFATSDAKISFAGEGPDDEGTFKMGTTLRGDVIPNEEGHTVDVPSQDITDCQVDCKFTITMNQDFDIVVTINKPIQTAVPAKTFQPLDMVTPSPEGAGNFTHEFQFKITVDDKSLSDVIAEIQASADAKDDVTASWQQLTLWVEVGGVISEEKQVGPDISETFTLEVELAQDRMSRDATFHLGPLIQDQKIISLNGNIQSPLNFDLAGRNDIKFLETAVLLEIIPSPRHPPGDSWYDAILDHPGRIFVGFFIVLYLGTLVVSERTRSISWNVVSFFLPSNRLETKEIRDKLNQINDTLGSANLSGQSYGVSPTQRAGISDELLEEFRVLRDQIQQNSSTIDALQRQIQTTGGAIETLGKRVYQELDINAASKDAAGLLPDANRDRHGLSERVIMLGASLRDSVAEIVGEQELANPDEYWAVQDRRQLLQKISVHLEEQERRRRGNLEHISDTIRQLRSLNVRQNLGKIEDLSKPDGAGFENSETIAAILDDMLASVPRRPISPQIIEEIDAFSSHVEGLGITSRFIPAALVEICRELVASSSPEEVDQIERIISRVIESARNRF